MLCCILPIDQPPFHTTARCIAFAHDIGTRNCVGSSASKLPPAIFYLPPSTFLLPTTPLRRLKFPPPAPSRTRAGSKSTTATATDCQPSEPQLPFILLHYHTKEARSIRSSRKRRFSTHAYATESGWLLLFSVRVTEGSIYSFTPLFGLEKLFTAI